MDTTRKLYHFPSIVFSYLAHHYRNENMRNYLSFTKDFTVQIVKRQFQAVYRDDNLQI